MKRISLVCFLISVIILTACAPKVPIVKEELPARGEDTVIEEIPEEEIFEPGPLPELGIVTGRVPTEEDLVEDEAHGLVVINQALIIVDHAFDRDNFTEDMAPREAEIIGEISALSVYQIGLKSESYTELQEELDWLADYPGVKAVTMNSILASQDMEGELWSPVSHESYDAQLNRLMASNMGFPQAWRILAAAAPRAYNVAVGVLDTFADPNYREFDSSVKMTLDTRPSATGLPQHATKVIGVIAARPDDDYGLTGVASILGNHLSIYHNNVGLPFGQNAVASFEIMRTVWEQRCRGASIFNMSFGPYSLANVSYKDVEFFKMFLEVFLERDPALLFVVAAGNESLSLDGKNYYPGGIALDNVITVAAIDSNSRAADFTNYHGSGGEVSISAYGKGLLTGETDRGDLVFGEGTSYSAPYVTATAALIRSVYPRLTGPEIKTIILNTASDSALLASGGGQRISTQVSGRLLRADRALLEAINQYREQFWRGRLDMDQLLALTDIQLMAYAETDGYRLEASVPETNGEETKLVLDSRTNQLLEGDHEVSVRANEKAVWKVKENPDVNEQKVWISRSDTDAKASVVLDESLPLALISNQALGYPDSMPFTGRLRMSPNDFYTLDGNDDAANIMETVFQWRDNIGDTTKYPIRKERYGWSGNDRGLKTGYNAPDVSVQVQYYSNSTVIRSIRGYYKKADDRKEILIEFYENGDVQAASNAGRYPVDNGEVFARFLGDKVLFEMHAVESGVLNSKSYHRDTYLLAAEQNYVRLDDRWVLDGLSTWYRSNGMVSRRATYFQDKLDGLNESFYENGEYKSVINYKKGLKEGTERTYEETAIGSGEYFLMLEVTNYQGLRDGPLIAYWPDSTLKYKVEYKMGVLDGVYEFYLKGQLHIKGQIVDGVAVGTWTEYKEDGSVHGTGPVVLERSGGNYMSYVFSIGYIVVKQSGWVYVP